MLLIIGNTGTAMPGHCLLHEPAFSWLHSLAKRSMAKVQIQEDMHATSQVILIWYASPDLES